MASNIHITAAKGSLVERMGKKIECEWSGVATLIDACNAQTAKPFAELSDRDFADGLINPVLEISDALRTALAVSDRIIVVISQGYLGDWHRVPEAAASAAIVGLMRSLALEYMVNDIIFNIIALPLGAAEDDAALIEEAAWLVELLLKSSAISGQILTLDHGRSLKMTKARRR